MSPSRQTLLFASSDEDIATPRSEDVRALDILAEEVLPEKARTGDYPVQFDHCFRRIAYDVAVGAKWDTEVASPFYKHATSEQLRRAVEGLREMAANPERAVAYNQQSLRFRNACE